MARLLPEQLEFDFFAPPTEQAKKPEKRAVSAAFKDADILKFQLTRMAAENWKTSEKT